MLHLDASLRLKDSPIAEDTDAFFGRWSIRVGTTFHTFHVRLRNDGTIHGIESDSKELDPVRINEGETALHGRFHVVRLDKMSPSAPVYFGYVGREHKDYCSVLKVDARLHRLPGFKNPDGVRVPNVYLEVRLA